MEKGSLCNHLSSGKGTFFSISKNYKALNLYFDKKKPQNIVSKHQTNKILNFF